MDSPNQKDHAHGSKYSMIQGNDSNHFSFGSSDKYDYQKQGVTKNSNIKPLIVETKNCSPALCLETEIKHNESMDHDVVIKQFDDLISELLNLKDSDKKYSDSCNLCDIVLENSMKNVKNLVGKDGLCAENYIDNSICQKENDCSTQSHKLKEKVSETHTKINPVEHNSDCYLQRDNFKLDCTAMCGKNLNDLEAKESTSWVDSNLWYFENEKLCQFQKPVYHKVRKNIHQDVLCGKSKDVQFNLTQPTGSNLEYWDGLNNSAFYTMQVAKRRHINYSGYKDILKHDYRRFPQSGACFKKLNSCDSNFQTVKVGGSISGQKSQRTTQSPVSKYLLPNNCFVVKLFIETRDLHLGPFPFEIYPKMSLRLLKLKVEQEHGINASSQKWILGKCLVADNDKSLVDYNVQPGSSIILYVDNNQKVSYNASKNEFIGVGSDTEVNNKVVNDSIAVERTDCVSALESLQNKPERGGASELLKKDSSDSMPIHSCLKTENENFIKSHSSDNISIMKEQGMNPALQGIICEKTKSCMIKKKGPKKSTELKKKRNIAGLRESNISSDNNKEKLFFENQNSDRFYTHEHIFLKGKKATTENYFSNSVQTKATYESKPNYFQVTPLDDVNIIQNNDSDNFEQYKQQISSGETACAPLNFSEETSVQDIELAHKNPPLRDATERSNSLGPSCSMFSPKDLKTVFGENENRNEEYINNMGNSLKTGKMHNNIKDKFLAKESKNHALSNISVTTEKEIVDDLSNEKVVKKVSLEEHSKNEEANIEDCSANILGKLDFEDSVPEKISKNIIQSNISSLEETEKVENLYYKIISPGSSAPKPKQSVTSLIRKLSLTRKRKSLDDSSSLHNITFNKLANGVMTDEKTSEHPALNTNQSPYSDIHIEISPQNPDVIPIKNENAEQRNDKNPLVVPAVHTLNPESVKNFELLLEIENMDLVENATNFICPVCFDEFESGQGVILHDCLHVFCRDCLASSISHADGALVKCPYRDDFYSCQSPLQQREIKALVSEDLYEKYLQRSIITAESSEERSFHCKTLDCLGWCIYDNAINVFHCPVCFHYNCLNCQAIHEGLNCRQYQDKLKLQQKVDQDAQKTLELLNKMIESGKALRCPKCDLILMKKWGCDWLKCSICQTEICWITKGPRWGPGGQGDTSGGCRCGINGVKCHPSCTYCH